MIVQCPNCTTTYKVAGDLIRSPNPTFRCSRCKHIFSLGALRSEAESSGDSDFPLPSSESGENPEDAELNLPPHSSERGEAEEPFLVFPKEDLSGSEGFDAPTDSEESRTGYTAENRQLESGSGVPSKQEAHLSETRDPVGGSIHLSTTHLITLLGVLLLFYSGITLMHQSHPTTVESLLKAIPGMKSLLFENSYLGRRVTIESVVPRLDTISGNREVFVLSGLSVNRNPIKVREIRILGTVYNRDGNELERHLISVGNPISSRILADLTPQEITILQKLRPQSRFEIPPEDSAPFTIVFLKPPSEIQAFSTKVLAAEEGS